MPVLSTKPVADSIYSNLTRQIEQIQSQLQLAILLVGDDPASLTYVRLKMRRAQACGIAIDFKHLPADTSTDEVLSIITTWNSRPDITAILVQLPLPASIDRQLVLESIDPKKDVDGLHSSNADLLMEGQPCLVPATALGVMRLLEYYSIELNTRPALVIGRSKLVGWPVAVLLGQAGAQVEVAHRQTTNLSELVADADIIVSAAGHPGLVLSDWLQPDTVVIDVGTTKVDGHLVGDVDPAAIEVARVTPVPGGVGRLTIACLLENVWRCFMWQTTDQLPPLFDGSAVADYN